MPFLSRRLVEYMLEVAPGYDVAMPRLENGQLEPLHAVYAQSCVAPIEALLAQGSLKIDRFLDRVAVRYVEEAELTRLDPAHLSFLNINTPADLARAEELLSRSRT